MPTDHDFDFAGCCNACGKTRGEVAVSGAGCGSLAVSRGPVCHCGRAIVGGQGQPNGPSLQWCEAGHKTEK